MKEVEKTEIEAMCNGDDCPDNPGNSDEPQGKMREKSTVSVQRTGEGQFFITIPKALALAMNLKKKDELRVTIDFDSQGLLLQRPEDVEKKAE